MNPLVFRKGPNMGRRAKNTLPEPKNDRGNFYVWIGSERFWVGTDHAEAAIRTIKIDQVWRCVERVWQSDRGTTKPIWDEETIQIARSVARGEEVCLMTAPTDLDDHNDTDADKNKNIAYWLALLQRQFPVVRLALNDHEETKRQDGQRQILKRAATRRRSAERIEENIRSSQMLHAALDAYLEAERIRLVDSQGKIRDVYWKTKKQATNFKKHIKDKSLDLLTTEEIEAIERYWSQRPKKEDGKLLSYDWCSEQVKMLRAFLKWLHKSKAWIWKKPDDYEPGQKQIMSDYEEEKTTLGSDQVSTYTIEELTTLWQYALPIERLMIALALNCGFGRGEIATLKTDQIHVNITHPKYKVTGSFIGRMRKKTRKGKKGGIYAEWILWKETVQAIEWYKERRPINDEVYFFLSEKGRNIAEATSGGNANQFVANMWEGLTQRIRKQNPEFRKLSFNKLRKTSQDAIRQMRGGEIAGMFGGRGRVVQTDDQIERYANRPFKRLYKTIRRYRRRLAIMFDSVSEPFPNKPKK